MRYGPLIFLATLFALSSSWVGFVLAPQLQVGHLQQTNVVSSGGTYPVARPGLAREGMEVYRANGCQYCHTEQVHQTGTAFDVVLMEAGTNQPALIQALVLVREGLPETDARQFLSGLPQVVCRDFAKDEADAAVKRLSVGMAKAQVWVFPTGPEIARGWGKRHSVAEDYLFDYPVMLGSRRVGPDLANVGARLPDPNWHFLHLYAPSLEATNSTMPPYRFLFEKRRIERVPSPDALVLPEKLAPPPGYEIVPSPNARTLVAYLLSLRADAPLFDAPVTVPVSASSTSTNAATATSETTTNTASTNAPPK